MKTTMEAVQELPETQQEALLNRFGYEVTNNRHIDCPICSKKKSFRINWNQKIDPPQYSGICTCGSYPLYKLIIETGADIHAINDAIGFKYGDDKHEAPPIKREPKIEKLLSIFRESEPLRNVQGAVDYLHARGIYDLPSYLCRATSSLPHYNADGVKVGEFDAIVSCATDALGKPAYMHITWVENGKKAPVEMPRKQYGLLGNTIKPRCSIKFSNKSPSILAVGEGQESCLSYQSIYGVTSESCLNAGLLMDYRPPEYVKELHIIADNDHSFAGQAHAAMLKHRVILKCKWVEKIVIRTPSELKKDFNDVLLEGVRVDEQHWTR